MMKRIRIRIVMRASMVLNVMIVCRRKSWWLRLTIPPVAVRD